MSNKTTKEEDEDFMIQCDAPNCGKWYYAHEQSPPITPQQASQYEKYHCEECIPYHGPSTFKTRRVGLRKRKRINFVLLNDPGSLDDGGNGSYNETLLTSNAVSTNDGQELDFGSILNQRTNKNIFNTENSFLLQLNNNTEELNEEYAMKFGFNRPILFDNKSPSQLGLRLPTSTTTSVVQDDGNTTTKPFTYSNVAKLVGPYRRIQVIDTSTQLTTTYTLDEWVNYLNIPSNERERILNVITLEFSQTPLGELVNEPQFARSLDFVYMYWPICVDDLKCVNGDDRVVSDMDINCKEDIITGSVKRLDESPPLPPQQLVEESNVMDDNCKEDTTTTSNSSEATLNATDCVDNLEDLAAATVATAIQETKEQQDNEEEDIAQQQQDNEEDEDDIAQQLEDLNKEQPRVAKYCLMSAAGSYTDFHVDFGGTSVWYHVYHGSKRFYFIEPTSKNLKIYSKWATDKSIKYQFLPDIIKASGGEVYEVTLKQGQTMFIASGWIHAVYTPQDSLVFGGNFVHEHSLEMQLTIYRLEKQMKVGNQYKFPNYQKLMWYVAFGFLRKIKSMGGDDKEIQDDQYQQRQVQAICSTYPPHILRGYLALAKELQRWSSSREKRTIEQYPENMNVSKVASDLGSLMKLCTGASQLKGKQQDTKPKAKVATLPRPTESSKKIPTAVVSSMAKETPRQDGVVQAARLEDRPELGPGWRVNIVSRKVGKKKNYFYVSPSGERVRTLKQAKDIAAKSMH